MPDDRLKVRLPICSLKPKRKMSVDSFLDAKTETCSLVDAIESPDPTMNQGFLQAQTAASVLDENNDSIISLENANLNTTMNLSSFTSTNGGATMGSAVYLVSSMKKRREDHNIPETVKEVSRESEDSLNDRSS